MTYTTWRRQLALSESLALRGLVRAHGGIDHHTHTTPTIDTYLSLNKPTRRHGPRPTPRWSFDALAAACKHVESTGKTGQDLGDVGRVMLATGRVKSAVYRWRKTGLSTWTADEVACKLGLHPVDIWHDWYDVGVAA